MTSPWRSILLLSLAAAAPASRASAQIPAPCADRAAAFVENRGQWPDPVRFTARGEGWRAAIDDRGWRLALAGDSSRACVVRMNVLHGSGASPLGLDADTALQHWFCGERSGVGARSFQRVRFPGVVPGIEVVLRCEDGRLEYDLELAPHADLSALVLELEGATAGEIAADGSLELVTPLGPLHQSPPRAFELDESGQPQACPGAFVRVDATHFGFELRERRPELRAVIDPALIWSTYIGGNSSQTVRAIADAGSDTAVIAGSTDSADFPTTPGVFDTAHNGASDVFVSAFDVHGQLLWSTFLGGLGADEVRAIALDSRGVVALAGTTGSANLPVTSGAYDTTFGGMTDGFVAKLAKEGGALLWCSYLGGTKHDELTALALDATGAVTVAGWTTSTNFPATPGAYAQQLSFGSTSDGCLARLAADGTSLLWASYFGGNYVDSIEALALAPADAVIVGGATQSSNFPCTVGAPLGGEDGFVAIFGPGAGQLLLSTTVGGPGEDRVRAVASAGNANVFAAGRTDSPTLPVTPGAFGPASVGVDGFLVQLDPLGAIVACTYAGGAGSDEVLALSRLKTGEIFAAGWTDSTDFPTTPGAYDRGLNSGSSWPASDAFVLRTAPSFAKLSYSTYLGGSGNDRALALAPLDVDTVLLAGETDSYFFPTTPGAHRTSRGVLATTEGFASRLDLVKLPISYGAGNLNSFGAPALLSSHGFPSVAEQSFTFVVESATPNQAVVVFTGSASANQPLGCGSLFVRPPLVRVGAEWADFVGYAEVPYTLKPAMIGTTFFAQAWFNDPWAGAGCGLTSGLEVFVFP